MPAIPKRARAAEAPQPIAERDIQHAIRLRLGLERDLVLFRNAQAFTEVWNARTGKADMFRSGLGKGTADLVGILAPRGRWVSFEVKRAGEKRTEAQELHAALIKRMGGFACVVRSEQDAVDALERARMEASE